MEDGGAGKSVDTNQRAANCWSISRAHVNIVKTVVEICKIEAVASIQDV